MDTRVKNRKLELLMESLKNVKIEGKDKIEIWFLLKVIKNPLNIDGYKRKTKMTAQVFETISHFFFFIQIKRRLDVLVYAKIFHRVFYFIFAPLFGSLNGCFVTHMFC